MHSHPLLVALLLAAALPVSAANPPCSGAEYREFDFWIGEWEVYSGDKRVGANRIERISEGCALLETWRNAKGVEGRSINAYDASAKRWRQFWAGGDGGVLRLEGGLVDAAMVLEGVAPDASGKEVAQRITYTPLPDGTVRQLWEAADGKGGWTTSFDGNYRRSEAMQP